jgi:hypothetical protein
MAWCRESLSPVLWDFHGHTLSFIHNGHRIVWSVTTASTVSPTLAVASVDVMDDLLLLYQDLFKEPTDLPLPRHHSHRICLLLEMAAIMVKPYRYAHMQKAELERQCDVMLCLGVI